MLNLAENTTQLEARIAAYDDAKAKLESLKIELGKVQAHHEETRDDDQLSAIDRAKKVVHLKSMFDVLSSDASRQQKVVDEFKKQVFELSDELFNYAGGEINSLVHSKTQQLLAGLKAEFDISGTPGVEEMVKSHRSIKDLEQTLGGVSIYRSLRDADERLARARLFRADVLEKLT